MIIARTGRTLTQARTSSRLWRTPTDCHGPGSSTASCWCSTTVVPSSPGCTVGTLNPTPVASTICPSRTPNPVRSRRRHGAGRCERPVPCLRGRLGRVGLGRLVPPDVIGAGPESLSPDYVTGVGSRDNRIVPGVDAVVVDVALVTLPWAPEGATTHHTPFPAYGSCCLKAGIEGAGNGVRSARQGYGLGCSGWPRSSWKTSVRRGRTGPRGVGTAPEGHQASLRSLREALPWL